MTDRRKQQEEIDPAVLRAHEKGMEMVRAHLAAVNQKNPKHLTLAYASGMASGISEFVELIYGRKRAFDLMTELADDVITPTLPEGE